MKNNNMTFPSAKKYILGELPVEALEPLLNIQVSALKRHNNGILFTLTDSQAFVHNKMTLAMPTQVKLMKFVSSLVKDHIPTDSIYTYHIEVVPQMVEPLTFKAYLYAMSQTSSLIGRFGSPLAISSLSETKKESERIGIELSPVLFSGQVSSINELLKKINPESEALGLANLRLEKAFMYDDVFKSSIILTKNSI